MIGVKYTSYRYSPVPYRGNNVFKDNLLCRDLVCSVLYNNVGRTFMSDGGPGSVWFNIISSITSPSVL